MPSEAGQDRAVDTAVGVGDVVLIVDNLELVVVELDEAATITPLRQRLSTCVFQVRSS